jgi:hypothetical protein
MKTLISLILTCPISLFVVGQNWAPVGATWYYEIVYPFSPQLSYIKYESVGDTNILGIPCKIITVTEGTTGCGFLIGNSDTAYTYEDGGRIYVYDLSNNGFSLIYNFAAEAGSTWTTIWDTCSYERMILSVDSIDINGFVIKTLSYGGYKIIERIGGELTLFHGLGEVNCKPPDTIAYELPFVQRLRCYHDSNLGFYTTGISPSCDYVTGIELYKYRDDKVNIYPNPARDEMTIEFKIHEEKYHFINLFTLLGEKILTIKTTENIIHLPLSNTPPGQYYIYISNGVTENYVEKIIINAP